MEMVKSKPDCLKEILLEKIRGGVYPVGGTLPSSRSLEDIFRVSKFTVAQTLKSLNESGYIAVEHGKSTRILRCPARYRIVLMYWGPDLQEQNFWSGFYRGILDEAARHPDFEIILLPQHSNNFNTADLGPNVNGVMVLGTCRSDLVDFLHEKKIQVLHLYDYPNGSGDSYVTSDLKPAVDEIIGEFALRGHRRLAYFDFEYPDGINRQKMNLVRSAAERFGMAFDEKHRVSSLIDLEKEYRNMSLFLREPEPVNAVFIGSDLLAPPILRAIHDQGRRIPEDVLVAGCDNLNNDRYLIPSLTSIELNRTEQGRLALLNLAELIAVPGSSVRQSVLPVKVVYRESLPHAEAAKK